MKRFLRADLDSYKPVFELYCFPCKFEIVSFKEIHCD